MSGYVCAGCFSAYCRGCFSTPEVRKEIMQQGKKFDQDKDRWELLPWNAVGHVVKVLTFGAKKYGDHNWQLVQGAKQRYFGAAQRHLTAYWAGEKKDPETKISHLAHAACCVLFLLWGELNKENDIEID